MHEMSTDELDELAKQVSGGKGGKWRFDKEHRLLFIDKVVGGAIPKEFIRQSKTACAKRWKPAFWRATKWWTPRWF